MRTWLNRLLLTFLIAFPTLALHAQEPVVLGLNYPETGPYGVDGLDQLRAAELAVAEINAAGGILGRPVELVRMDSQADVDVTRANVASLIEEHGASMMFGSASSATAIAAGEECAKRTTLYFAVLSYSTETTGAAANRYLFRECSDAHAASSALASYMREHFSRKKYCYLVADYTFGWTTETAMRVYTSTEDTTIHKSIRIPSPKATDEDFKRALTAVKLINPDVLVLVLGGSDFAHAVQFAKELGLKDSVQIVCPNLTLGMAEMTGVEYMEGIIGALPWTWRVPYEFNYPRGIEFVEAFKDHYFRYPSTAGASAYTIVHEYKAAVERAGTFDTEAVIAALEGHTYTLLKDRQTWRSWDHQSVQTVYVVRVKPADAIRQDPYQLDFFEIIDSQSGTEAFIKRSDWNAVRKAARKPTKL